MKAGNAVTRADVESLKNVLEPVRSWMNANAIMQLLKWDKRFIRAVASASGGQIIGSQKGYKLTRKATPDEARHAAADFRSRGEANLKRGGEIEIAFFQATQPSLAI